MNRFRQRPVNSFSSAPMKSSDRNGFCRKPQWNTAASSSAARSMYSVLSQCDGESGFVVANIFAPGTDIRESAMRKKSSG